MNRDDMLKRTRDFALRVIAMVAALPDGRQGDILGKQVLKSGTSIGANYREAIHGSSHRHFVTCMGIAQREAEETLYWLDLIAGSKLVKATRLTALTKECQELLAILTASIRTAKSNKIA